MPKIQYKEIAFKQKSLDLIELVNSVIDEYRAQGYELTLRQAYYQLVARGYIENNERSYKNIGSLINDGRLAGLIDWNSITDRTRNLRNRAHWDQPQDVIYSAKYSYLLDKWEGQPNYVEVWVEKDALIDIQERLEMFGADVYVKRVALTMNQVTTYNPPPNPAKITDSRCGKYIDQYGEESWELDALEPQMLTKLITNDVTALRDDAIYQAICDREEAEKRELQTVADEYQKVISFLSVEGDL